MDLLLWGIERGARPAAFGRRAVVRIEFTDRPPHRSLWWYLNEDGRCQLCLADPGGETDLFLSSSVADLVGVYRGNIPLARALEDRRLEAIGSRAARAALAAWLNLGPLTQVRPARGG
jgi:hypothetical protein